MTICLGIRPWNEMCFVSRGDDWPRHEEYPIDAWKSENSLTLKSLSANNAVARAKSVVSPYFGTRDFAFALA